MRRASVPGKLRGFTLIEMTVVITILAVMAAAILPNLVALKRSRDSRTTAANIARLPGEARDAALRYKMAVTLRVDGDALVMERIPPPPSTQNTPAGLTSSTDQTNVDEGTDPIEIRRVATGDFHVQKTRLVMDTPDTASWLWKIYPDGSSTSASLEFQEGNAIRTLVIDPAGNASWIEGDEPAHEEERWTAGELEQRGG